MLLKNLSNLLAFEKVTDKNRISEIMLWARENGYLERLNISEDNDQYFTRHLLGEQGLLGNMLAQTQLKTELKQVTLERTNGALPLSSDEAEQLFVLIESGEVFEDVFYMLSIIFTLIIKPDRFSDLSGSFKSYISALTDLPEAIISDLDPRSGFENISIQIKEVQKGGVLNDPEILDHTLKVIYSTPEAGNIIGVINALLDPKNESLRIVLLIYARLNGINLQQQDIDMVRESILEVENPKMGVLLKYLLTPDNAKRLAGA